MAADSRARLDRVMAALLPVIATLDPEDAAWAVERFEPASYAAARRIALRDVLVLRALDLTPGMNVTARAAELERRLRRAERGAKDPDAALIIGLSEGRTAPGWKHICKIERIARADAVRANASSDAHDAPARSAA